MNRQIHLTWNSLFDALRGQRALRMACCDSVAVPKRSRLGLPFFAHARRGACDYAHETELHLQAKLCLLEGALIAGWDAQLEVTGQGGDGLSWRADVLCVHLSTGERVALEFQRSAQTAAQMQARQEQYRSGGVRGWWFVVSPHLSGTRPWQAGTPALRVTPELTVPELGVSLSEAATLALTGGLTLLPSALFPLTLTVLTLTERCGECLTLFATLTAFGLHHRDACVVRVTEWTAARLAWCREVLGSAWPLDTELLLRPWPGRDGTGTCPACGGCFMARVRREHQFVCISAP